mmetsp:Transcript_8196/g.14616  ORF Transcript_8196/g.14616 Transcript_8196/m.14616 type:complete len:209 (+) Transcript_8196:656-1282(+)
MCSLSPCFSALLCVCKMCDLFSCVFRHTAPRSTWALLCTLSSRISKVTRQKSPFFQFGRCAGDWATPNVPQLTTPRSIPRLCVLPAWGSRCVHPHPLHFKDLCLFPPHHFLPAVILPHVFLARLCRCVCGMLTPLRICAAVLCKTGTAGASVRVCLFEHAQSRNQPTLITLEITLAVTNAHARKKVLAAALGPWAMLATMIVTTMRPG